MPKIFVTFKKNAYPQTNEQRKYYQQSHSIPTTIALIYKCSELKIKLNLMQLLISLVHTE